MMTRRFAIHDQAKSLIQEGKAAAREGRRGTARRNLLEATRLDPLSEEAWLWLAAIAATPEETLNLLQRVIVLNPANQRARSGIAAVERRLAKAKLAEAKPAKRGASSSVPSPAVSALFRREPPPLGDREQVAPGWDDLRTAASRPQPASVSAAAPSSAVSTPAKPASPAAKPLQRVNVYRLLVIVLILAAIVGLILLALLVSGVVPALALQSGLPNAAAASGPGVAAVATPPVIAPLPMRRSSLVPVATPTDDERLATLMGLLAVPWDRQDWPRVLELIRQSRARDDSLAQEKAFSAQMNWALALVSQANIEEALPHFAAARAIRPDDLRVTGEQFKAENYLAGQHAMAARDWPAAITALTRVIAVDADYLIVRQLLAEAFWQQGQADEGAGQLTEAAAAYRQALAAEPGRVEVRTQLAHVTQLLTPPTPTPTVTPTPGPERWIEVDLSEQRLRAYEGERIVLDVLVSTGLPRTPTVTGKFRVWAKMVKTNMEGGDPALNNYYNLKNVPYVMYFHNDYGLHGTYWHNDFGRPHSHGCVNMRTEDAKWLFGWTSPRMPKGKTTLYSTEQNPGTWVVVHQ